MKILGFGGVGAVLQGFHRLEPRFVLKIVSRTRDRNSEFWSSASSVQSWCAKVRFANSCFTKVPVAMEYWIHEDDLDRRGVNDHLPRRLSRLIDNCHGKLGDHGELPDALADIVPREYVLCPEQQLERIFEEDNAGIIRSWRLLYTYPIQWGGEKNVGDYIEKRYSFSEKELQECFYQILKSIEYLYQINAAHGDIKPANILVTRSNDGSLLFRLSDIDAFYSEQTPSTLMTPAFLPVESVQRKLKERAASDTEFRILLDCFALGRTIAWMFSPEHSLPPPPDYRMPEILKRFSTLDQLTLENFKQTITDLEKDYGCELKKASYIPYALSGQFDEALNCCCGDLGKPGTFHEQIRFTREIDPLLKSEGDFRKFPVCSVLTDVLHQPIGIDINYSYFHAPDDAVTGKIPRDFDNYTPKSLENTRATSKEAELIISYGRKLNGYFHSAPGERRFLPRKRDIIWCNGQPVIFWGKGWCLSLEQKIDYEACFRYFCTGETKHFSLDDWLELLPLLPELQDALPGSKAQLLYERFISDPGTRYAWLFGYRAFRKYAAAQKEPFTLEKWLAVHQYTPEFDSRLSLSPEEAWETFLDKRVKRKELLAIPEFSRQLEAGIPPYPDIKRRCNAFLKYKKYDPESFLRWFPREIRQELTPKEWDTLLCCNPELLQYMPDSFAEELALKTWIRLLTYAPSLAESLSLPKRLPPQQWQAIRERLPHKG